MTSRTPLVVVTGANGFVGARLCEALAERGARVRALVRTAGSAPARPEIEEAVGDFADADVAARVLAGADAAITTVHPMGSDRAVQRAVGVEGTLRFAHAAVGAGVGRLIHVSTAAVYDRSPGAGDVDETSALVGEDANDYAVTKRDADLALGELAGITRVLLRPPAILGAGPTSVWNTLQPAAIRDDEAARHAVAEASFAWVHVDDLVALAAGLAYGTVPEGDDPERGPVDGACVAVNVAAGRATQRDYLQTVADALGVEPVWDASPGWTGAILSDRARHWGWSPTVDLTRALEEIAAGLRSA